MEQKLIRVYRDDTTEFDYYISKGWVVSQISASACASSTYVHSYCYVLLTKNEELKNNG